MPDKEEKEEAASKAKEFGYLVMRAFERMSADNVNIMASGLVYSTLIAIVPCISFLFVFLSAFGVLQSFVELINETFVDLLGAEAGSQITTLLGTYTSNAMGLGIFGLISFMITAVLLTNKVCTVFNRIFRSQQTRSTMKRFISIFTSLIVLVLVLAIILTLRTGMTNMLASLTGTAHAVTSTAMNLLKHAVYLALAGLAIFLLYYFVPNTKIRARSALIGSVSATVALAITLTIFSNVSSFFVNYSVIYGSLATVFVMLLFLYVAWYIILVAAELVYVHQFRPAKGESYDIDESPARQISDSVNLLLLIGRNYKNGLGAMTYKDIAKNLSLSPQYLYSYLQKFEKAGILLSMEDKDMSSYVPARPLDQIYMKKVLEAIFGNIVEEDGVSAGEAIAEHAKEASISTLEDLTLEDLLERS